MPGSGVIGNGEPVSGLGGPLGYGEITLGRDDDGSHQIDLSAVFENGIVIDGVTYDARDVFVNTNGSISFGEGIGELPTDLSALLMPYLAVFMADVDTRIDGEGPESGQIYVDVDPVSDVVTITWVSVGFYRRDASLTNTFQVQLMDRGDGTFDLVYRYGDINWTSGALENGWNGLGGTPATIGYRLSASGNPVLLSASGDEALQLELETDLGNTNRPGLWVFESATGAAPTLFTGSSAADALTGTWRGDLLQGLAEDDMLTGGGGADTLEGGDGTDTADYLSCPERVVADLFQPANNTSHALGDVYSSIENLRGTFYGDDLRGDLGANMINGHIGNDFVMGRGGDDTLIGSFGNDILSGGEGDDVLSGGIGNDRLIGDAGYDRMMGDAGNDTLLGGPGANAMFGGAGDDTLLDGHDASNLFGNDGADRMIGNSGNDRLYGGDGNDTLNGGGGADRLRGDEGFDYLVGGAGTDWFIFGVGDDRDRFADYTVGTDKLFLEDELWGGGLTAEEVVSTYGVIENGMVKLIFAPGTEIWLENVTSFDGLANDIVII